MINVSAQATKPLAGVLKKLYSYNEIIEYLDSLPVREYVQHAVDRARQLDTLFDNVSQKIATILVGGTNGKSMTINFADKLFAEEGIKTALIYSTHFLAYNERFIVGNHPISNTDFADIANEVINAAQENKIAATSSEIMLFTGLLHAQRSGVEVALIEVGLGGQFDPSAVCSPKITAVTRVADDISRRLGSDLDEVAHELISVAQKDAWFVSAEQSKLRLQKMKTWVEQRESHWAMPIRKLAPLPYVYEQLYGRIASLGERIAQIYVEEVKQKFSPFLRGNLLATQQGQRGRPTLEAKRNAELNPIKTMRMFWHEQFSLLRGRFEVLDKEKPVILLDNASNLDAFMNVFLGVRLLHYQKHLKGFVLILGASKALHAGELVKSVRYLLKKVPGEVFFVSLPGTDDCCDPGNLLALARDFNVKARAFDTFDQALKVAKESVDERDGLVAVTGSAGMVSAYWRERGIKKL